MNGMRPYARSNIPLPYKGSGLGVVARQEIPLASDIDPEAFGITQVSIYGGLNSLKTVLRKYRFSPKPRTEAYIEKSNSHAWLHLTAHSGELLSIDPMRMDLSREQGRWNFILDSVVRQTRTSGKHPNLWAVLHCDR